MQQSYRITAKARTINAMVLKVMIWKTESNKSKKLHLESLPDFFTDRRKKKDKEEEELIDELYRQIGKLKIELNWPKKIKECLVFFSLT